MAKAAMPREADDEGHTMKNKSWFRITVDGSGRVLDCRPVCSEGSAEQGVYFKLATSAREASHLATKSHEARLLAARRARYETEGLCKCGRERDRKDESGKEMKTCSGCAERHAVHEERRKARTRGEDVPPLDRRAVLLERKQKDANNVRLEALIEVQRAWAKSRNNHRGFERWLAAQIEAITGKAVA